MTEPTVLGGRYEVGDQLGRGGMAEVRRALDTRLGRQVAVKRLRVDLAGDSTFQARFRREAQSAAGLNHPNIVSVYDTGEEPDPSTGVSVPYIVMELVEGHTLRDILRQGRKILPERALELAQGVLDALDYSHRAGIVHRDIKPANVMLTPSGQVKVMDFGIARAVADTSATMTQTAAVIGTAQYLSPEQARGEKVDARSDLYSAGCLLFELLTGRPPFVGDSPVSVAYQHVREEPVPPSQIDPVIDRSIDAVVLKSLAKDPAERYQSAREMRDDIARVLAGEAVTTALPPSPVVPVPVPEQPTRVVSPEPAPVVHEEEIDEDLDDEDEEEEGKSRTGLWVGLGILAVLLVAGLVFALYMFTRPAEPPPAKMVAVPAVIGQTEQQATNTLEGVGLKVKVEQVQEADDSSVGQVIDQQPAAQQEVEEGSTVTITVNVGPEKFEIPGGLVGKSREEVRKILNEAGFTNIKEEASTSEPAEAKKDEVLSVDPSSGSVTKDTEFTVVYATGMTQVPNWVGKSRDEVESQAAEAGLEVTFEEAESEQPPGTVVKTDPGAGTQVPKGSSVKATVAVEPKTVAVPNWIGQTRNAVQNQANELGLKVEFAEEESDAPAGTVIRTEPESGAQVDKGSTVKVVLAIPKQEPPEDPTPSEDPTGDPTDEPTP
ncbi:Stk1 family PASTA domain-containing Ser/Thr kinase [Enemella sp. A6]|uniref:Stk1 family PASTA domain-containing Ser/Thr kinase n=1 Tax=Enemella sp. A6 TaxID=3440152 RepID=UPI003EBAB78C